MSIDIKKPVIIIGTGRTGSTLFHQILAFHEHLMWLSGLAERFPGQLGLNRWVVMNYTKPNIGPLLQREIHPGEPYRFWEEYARGFSRPYRDLLAADVTPRTKQQLRRAFETLLTAQKNRMMVKITGWSRVGYLHEIFPDARFIHLVRDGRAVVNSYIHIDFWHGWYGPHNWRWGPLSPEYQDLWDKYDQSFVALAAIQQLIVLQSIENARCLVDDESFLEIRYEDLCQNPVDVFRQVANFAELEWLPGFETFVRVAPIRSANDRFHEELSAEQLKIVEEILGDQLAHYRYT